MIAQLQMRASLGGEGKGSSRRVAPQTSEHGSAQSCDLHSVGVCHVYSAVTSQDSAFYLPSESYSIG
jgi:hypothetical protein